MSLYIGDSPDNPNGSRFNRYQSGGDLYAAVSAQYGGTAADAVAAAARTGSDEAVNNALSNARRGKTDADYDTRGTWEIFVDQVTTDPLAAPLESANRQLGKAWWNLFTSPWVLITIGAVAFFALGGWGFLQRSLAKRG